MNTPNRSTRRAAGEASYFSRIAPLYRLQHRLELPAIRAAVDLAALTSTDRLLDAATGTGAVLHEVARRGIRPAHVVGIDASQRMLDRAGTLPAAWELRRGDVHALPIDDGSFDVVTAGYLLHLMMPNEVETALAELSRVLAPGGRIITVTPTSTPIARGPLRRRVSRLLARAAPNLATSLRPLDPTPALIDAGFDIEDSCVVESGYRSLCLLATSTGTTSTQSGAARPRRDR